MASFEVEVDGKKYTMEYNRESVRQFEEIGGTMSDLKEKLYSSTDKLFYVGLMKFHHNISFSEAKELSDKAIEEFGVDTIYSALVERYMDVFMRAGNKPAGKSFLVLAKS